MKNHRNFSAQFISFVFLFVIAFIFLVPILFIFISSFKVDKEIYQAGGFLLFPKTWTIDNYKMVLDPNYKQLPIFRWYANSFFISSIHAAAGILIYSLSAYGYAKLKFAGRDIIFLVMLFLSSFPVIVNLIPLYKLMLGLGWLNRPMALIIPGLSGMYNIFLIRQFMYGIPDSLIESAHIDGSGELRIFFQIILPLIKPILIAVGLFCFISNWNDFLWPSIAMSNIDKLTLTAGLQLVKGMYNSTSLSKLCTIGVFAIFPMIILYLFSQRYFINGIAVSSGVKG
jgi:multiple sugar transport system permease protein